MKTEWICRWQYIPGRKEHCETYDTLDGARRAMAKVLTDAVDLSGYIRMLREEEGEDCNSSADFLEKFLKDLIIPQSEEEIPPHLDIPDHCVLVIDPCEGFRWEYARRECPSLTVSHVYYGSDGHPFIVDFMYESPVEIKPDRVNAVWIQMEERINYGTSAYPLMVWYALREEPKTQKQITKSVQKQFGSAIDRKAVGRHLQLLENLGYPVQAGPAGYFRGGEKRQPRTDIRYTASAYPLLVLQVLDETPKTKAAIIRAVQEKFGPKINRKAVGRHLELLKAFGHEIQKTDDGYCISK